MSMRPRQSTQIPIETVRVARAAFPKGSLAIRIRDELGPLFSDEAFADLFGTRGKPAWSPGRSALVLVLQFVEGLTDHQAAEAVRARIDFKYALALELHDPGFDFSVLSEFRDRLVQAEAGRRVLDGILSAAREQGLLTSRAKARTDSTHVLTAARELSWLEMVAETLRSALNALARTDPAWIARTAEPDWFTRYATRAEESRFPKSKTKRQEVGARIGRDGMRLLEAAGATDAPAHLRGLGEVETLRLVWIQQFHQVEGEVVRRGPKDRPPGAMRLVTPYDLQARGSLKRDTVWDGYKVHLTETCEVEAVHLITNMTTTVATTPDSVMAQIIHDDLAARGCVPGEHWVDAGYPTASQIVAARRDHGVDLHGPVAANTGTHSAAGDGFDQEAFTIDWAKAQVTCPGGSTTASWHERRSQQGLPVIRVRFSTLDCRPCPLRGPCLGSSKQERRELRLRQHDEHHALRAARQEQETDAWKERYKVRAGIEGAISQGVGRCGLRRSRYRGLAKTSLAHQLIGAAINLVRIDTHLVQTPRARTRTSHFAALRPAERVLGGAK